MRVQSQFIEMFSKYPSETPWYKLLSIINGKAYPEEYNDHGTYPICGSAGVMYYGERKLCDANTIILGRKGNINRPIYMESDYWIVDTAFSLDVNKSILHPKYFYYWCCQYDFTKLNKQGVLPSLTRKDLEKIEMPVPPIAEQKKFVLIVEQADKSKFDGFKSQFIEMFGNSIHTKKLIEVCNIEKGSTITKEQTSNGDIPVVAGGLEPSCYHNVANRPAGMITVSASGANAGYVNYWEVPIFASDCNTIYPIELEKVSPIFMYWQLKVIQKQIYKLQKGGAQPHVYGKDLADMQIVQPPMEFQLRYVKIAEQADKSKYNNQK